MSTHTQDRDCGIPPEILRAAEDRILALLRSFVDSKPRGRLIAKVWRFSAVFAGITRPLDIKPAMITDGVAAGCDAAIGRAIVAEIDGLLRWREADTLPSLQELQIRETEADNALDLAQIQTPADPSEADLERLQARLIGYDGVRDLLYERLRLSLLAKRAQTRHG